MPNMLKNAHTHPNVHYKSNRDSPIMHIINSVGNSLDKASAEAMLNNMVNRSIIQLIGDCIRNRYAYYASSSYIFPNEESDR